MTVKTSDNTALAAPLRSTQMAFSHFANADHDGAAGWRAAGLAFEVDILNKYARGTSPISAADGAVQIRGTLAAIAFR